MYTVNIWSQIPRSMDTSRLKHAWKSMAANNPIVRTRIIHTSHGFFQVVVDKFPWQEHNASIMEPPRLKELVGQPLVQYFNDEKGGKLVLTSHHAVSDYWTLRLIQQQVEAAYQGQLLGTLYFHPFIQYTWGIQGVEEFWATQLCGLDAKVFPELPASNYRPAATQSLQHEIEGLCVNKQTPHTLPTHIYLAWALLISHYTDSPDVVYGTTLSGRNTSVLIIENMVGQTITTLPLRVKL